MAGKFYTENTTSMLSRQAIHLKEHWQKHQSELEKKRLFFQNRSCLLQILNHCQLCGLCQYGCRFELIYNSTKSLDLLKITITLFIKRYR